MDGGEVFTYSLVLLLKHNKFNGDALALKYNNSTFLLSDIDYKYKKLDCFNWNQFRSRKISVLKKNANATINKVFCYLYDVNL